MALPIKTCYVAHGSRERIVGVCLSIPSVKPLRVVCDFEIDTATRQLTLTAWEGPKMLQRAVVRVKVEVLNSMKTWSYPTTFDFELRSQHARTMRPTTGGIIAPRVKDLRNLDPRGVTLRLAQAGIVEIDLDPTMYNVPGAAASPGGLTLVRETAAEPWSPPTPEIIVIDNAPPPPPAPELSEEQVVGASPEKLRGMLRKLRQIEAAIIAREEEVEKERLEERCCPVCLEARKDTALSCGHLVCADCEPRLELCPICRAELDGQALRVFD